jgi:hypothetical protein
MPMQLQLVGQDPRGSTSMECTLASLVLMRGRDVHSAVFASKGSVAEHLIGEGALVCMRVMSTCMTTGESTRVIPTMGILLLKPW